MCSVYKYMFWVWLSQKSKVSLSKNIDKVSRILNNVMYMVQGIQQRTK